MIIHVRDGKLTRGKLDKLDNKEKSTSINYMVRFRRKTLPGFLAGRLGKRLREVIIEVRWRGEVERGEMERGEMQSEPHTTGKCSVNFDG